MITLRVLVSKVSKAGQSPRLATNFGPLFIRHTRLLTLRASREMASNSKTSQTSNEQIVTGGCHCKGVQFQFSKPILMLCICHCGDCRKLSGATVFDFVVLPRSKLKMISESTLKTYRSSEHGFRKFCGNCGCSVGGESEIEEFKDVVYIARGMCDCDPGPPEQGASHYWTREGSKAPWDKLPDDGYPRCLKDEVFLKTKS